MLIPSRSSRLALVLAMASGLVVASATVARADDGRPPIRPDAIVGSSIQTSGGIPGKGEGDPAFVAAKVAIAALYGEVRAGRARLEDYVTQRGVFESEWPFVTSPRALNGTDQADTVMWTENYLNVVQFAQSNGWYCGPGATMTALYYLKQTSYEGESLTQACLAGECGPGAPNSQKYLETNYWGQGGTPWYVSPTDRPVPGTLNYWRTGSYSGDYIAQFPSSLQAYKDALMSDIDWGFPVMPDVHEPSNGTHLWGHPPNVEIFHWITAFGYAGLGATTAYVDPAANSPLNWSGVNPYNYGFPSTDMYYLLSNNGWTFGIVW